jgi:ATP-dependent DNA helicase MPH1
MSFDEGEDYFDDDLDDEAYLVTACQYEKPQSPIKPPSNSRTPSLKAFKVSPKRADEEYANLLEDAFSSDIIDEEEVYAAIRNNPSRSTTGLRQRNLFGEVIGEEEQGEVTSLAWRLVNHNEPPTHHKIYKEAAKSWIYPTNVSHREYQFNITKRALFTNVLVALPTGQSV